jgi:thiamine biosynthesis lipoprotein
MGTVLEISIHGLERQAAAPLLDELYAVATELDALLSVYESDSEVSRLNRTAGGGPQRVDARVADLLEQSIGFSELTGGAFDVSVGPLVELWTQAAQRGAPPTPSELAGARARVGSQLIELRDGTATLRREQMALNLGGVAKGYALDLMLPVLERRGATSGLLNFGQSSTWALGAPPGSSGWRLLVRGPEGEYVGLITLKDRALSVSGSLGQWSEIGGQRYGHIIDPRSGEPLLRSRQALVVAPRAVLAEALSKALLILEADAGLALVAAQEGCHGLLIEDGGELRATSGWERAVSFERISKPSP